MSLPHGRGKESFRVFNRTLRDTTKYIRSALEEGEPYTQADIFRFYEQLINEYRDFLKGAELDVELWLDRAIDKQIQAYDGIVTTYDLETGDTWEDEEIINPEAENEEFDPADDDRDSGTLLGFTLLTSENKHEAREDSKPRKRLFTSLEDLQEYVSKVPYITYIQVIWNSVSGKDNYRVWVEASKDTKKRKS